MTNHNHTAALLHFLADALAEAADELQGGNEGRSAERLRLVHDAFRAAESAPDWETFGLLLEPFVARLRPPAEADDAWPFNEHLDDLPDQEDDLPPPNLALPFGKVN